MVLRCLSLFFLWLLTQASLSGADMTVSQFTVLTNQFAGPPLVGYGVAISPFLTAPNGGQTVGDLADLGQKLNTLAPQHVRIFVLTEWWRPGNEKLRDSFIRTCQMAQAAGATINVTLWQGWKTNPAQAAQDMAGLLQDLIVKRSLTAVRCVTLQNEVNSTKITMAQYNDFYRRFDQALRSAGIRDRLQIVGGDLVRIKQADWLRDLATELAPVCDGHSIHVYWEYANAPDFIPRRLGEVVALENALPAQGRRPLYLTEFGVRGQGWQVRGQEPGRYEDGTPITQTWVSALQTGWLMIEATRLGFVATVQWEACDVAYGRLPMHYGIIGEASEGWPLRPGYQVLRLFTHTTSPGWRALPVEGDSSGVLLTAVQGPKGELTLMVLNHSSLPQAISIAHLPSPTLFHRLCWNAAAPDRLQDAGNLAAAAVPLELALPARSITALTSGSDQWQSLRATSPTKSEPTPWSPR